MTTIIKKEVQKHGFTWERQLLMNVYGATKAELDEICYTSACDLPGALNRVNGASLSIKTTGSNAVCMGDARRIFDKAGDSSNPFHMTVVRYSQEGVIKRVQEIVEVNLTGSRSLLFGSVTRPQIEELDCLIKANPSGRVTKEAAAPYKALQASLNARMGTLILNPKIDSKSQRRLQCSFNQWPAFLAANPGLIVARSSTGALHAGAISETIESGRRVFRKEVV